MKTQRRYYTNLLISQTRLDTTKQVIQAYMFLFILPPCDTNSSFQSQQAAQNAE